MEFPTVTNLVAATFTGISSRGADATLAAGNAAQPIAQDGGMGADSDPSSGFGGDESSSTGQHLDTTA